MSWQPQTQKSHATAASACVARVIAIWLTAWTHDGGLYSGVAGALMLLDHIVNLRTSDIKAELVFVAVTPGGSGRVTAICLTIWTYD